MYAPRKTVTHEHTIAARPAWEKHVWGLIQWMKATQIRMMS